MDPIKTLNELVFQLEALTHNARILRDRVIAATEKAPDPDGGKAA